MSQGVGVVSWFMIGTVGKGISRVKLEDVLRKAGSKGECLLSGTAFTFSVLEQTRRMCKSWKGGYLGR